MTQEDKQLLLKDLCARLPYGAKVQIIKNLHLGVFTLYPSDIDELKTGIADIKPYLRPMSSMTEDEKREYNLTKTLSIVDYPTLESFDWLLAHHFDYRGLIEKGLAIEVTEDNNPYKN